MYKTEKKGREEERAGSVCVHVRVYHMDERGEGEAGHTQGKKESTGGCLVYRVI